MDAFLRQAARHYFNGQDIQETCFVFPNRRSIVFFRKYLGEMVKDRPMAVPRMYTINDFFCQLYGSGTTDRLRLLTELYVLYAGLYKNPEPLDQFIFWGDVMLSDFDDIDKYLADPRDLFRNIEDLKSIDDDFSYLTTNQRKAILRFLSNFRGATDDESVKARFVKIWNVLLPLYTGFNKTLREKGMAYEGMVYRSLAQRLESESAVDILKEAFPDTSKYVFVGLNALNECERALLRKMRDAGVAEFVWDYVSKEIQDPANKSSFFMKRNVEEFPQAFTILAGGLPEINVISVPSGAGQARLAPQILKQTGGDPVETAFVLPDETLLLPLLTSIPPEYGSINVTMGYPMKGSAVYTLTDAIGRMQLHLRKRDDGWYFHHREVREVFSSSLFFVMASTDEMAVAEKVKREAKYFIPEKDLKGGPIMDLIFKPVITEPKTASVHGNRALCRYLADITGALGRSISGNGEMLLELDFAKRLHTCLNVLEDTDLEVLPQTWLRILDSTLAGISVPFRGEPLKGLQVMGPLETRALDFRNLVILSANEGMFPRRSVTSSFIPPELRKGFGLPTYEYQDAVWAYYFYRLLQRAEKVWLVYDSRTEGLHSGEESRYIKQLQYHYGARIRRMVAGAPLETVRPEGDIDKTAQDVETVRRSNLSASALKSYLQCPAQFYYKVVKKLETPDDVSESLDSGMIGNVFHRVMQRLYSGKELVTLKDLEDVGGLPDMVREEVLREMHSVEVSGRNLVTEQIILDYVRETLEHDKKLLRESGSPGFRILGLELFREASFDGFRLIGFIDRVDSYLPGQVRIVDYKTGKVEDDDILITDANAPVVAGKLFGDSNSARPTIALQLFVYDYLMRPHAGDAALVNSIYSTRHLFTGALDDMPESQEFSRLVKERLSSVLSEITDLSVPFRRTSDSRTCEWCDFKAICGR